MIHDAELDPGLFETVHQEIVLSCVDSIEAVGMETWLAALAYGASHVVMVAGDTMGPEELDTLQTHISWASKILEGMGLEKERI